MRYPFAASLLVLSMVVSGPWSANGADADSLKADEQALQAANLGTDGPALLEFFRSHTLTEVDRERIQALIKQLGDDAFAARERASAELVSLGPKTIAFLRPAVKNGDPEVARRAGDCLRRLEQGGKNTGAPADHALATAAVRLLAARKPAGAVQVLLAYLPFAGQETMVEEIQLALVALALREGKTEPTLAAALTAPEPLRRGMAGAALAGAGVAEQSNAIRKLLQDPEPSVRLRIGLALAGTKDKEAVPVLIDLLGQLQADQAWPIENLLQHLAGEKAPVVSLGTDEASQRQCRNAWAKWWRDHGADVEMVALDRPRPLLGHTLVVITDYGQILEMDRDGKPRWQLDQLRSPFHAQLLPGDRILIAEYSGNVSERTLKGEILWQKQVPMAMQAQRLANGSTFVVTTTQLIEFDPSGKQTVLYTHAKQGNIVVAQKRRNGQTIVIDSDGTCMTLDATGKELSRFAVGKISNSCLDALPNGNVVVAKYFHGKVTEYDAQGKVVWEVACVSPFSVQRTPTGNTLVACHEPPRVVELDRTGKTVWEQKLESLNHRPWFASRR